MIRYFCHTDAAGPRAEFCISYAEAFLALGFPLRILPVEFVQSGTAWAKLRRYFTTVLAHPFVNVVNTHPFWWGRFYTVGVRNVLVTGDHPDAVEKMAAVIPASAQMAAGPRRQVVNGEVHEMELFEIPHERPSPLAVAAKYNAIVVPTAELVAPWAEVIDQYVRATGNDRDLCQISVVGVDLAERATALRRVLALDSE